MSKKAIENWDQLFNKLEAGIILVDTEHRIRWMNDKVNEWFGPLKLGEKRKCYRIQKFNDNFCRICPTRKAINFGLPTRYELTFPIKKKPYQFEIIALPIGTGDDKKSLVMELILCKSADKVYSKKAKDIMAQMEKMAAIGDLSAGIAHELNTPLATISIISQELKDILKKNLGLKVFNKEIQGYLQDIEAEINRCTSIIDDVQNFSKKGIHQKTSINLTDIILKTIDLVCKGGLPKGVIINKKLGIFPQVHTDPDRIRQVLLNILKNAVEAVALSKPKKEITLSVKRDNHFITIITKDTGIGISKDNFKRLFEPFFTTKPIGKGTGLGLFVSYGIMKDLGGDLNIESKKGEGTTVYLTLPLEQ